MDSEAPFFSVVMPVYNVEKYLIEAVKSVLVQTFSDFELILVDDCATDSSGILADKLSQTDARISVIHHAKNGGLSAARNSGLAVASGNYIFFMDSDDTIDADLLQVVYYSILENPAELIIFGLIEEYFNATDELKKQQMICPHYFMSSAKGELRKKIIFLENETLLGYAWNKIYSLNTLKKLEISFENITLIEDIVFNVKFCENLSSLNLLDFAPYHYKKRGCNSLTNKHVPEYFPLHQKRVSLIYDLHKKWGMLNRDVIQILGRIYMRYIYSALERNSDSKSNMNFHDKIEWCRKLYKERLFQILIEKNYKPNSFLFQIMLFPLKHHQSFALIIGGEIIHFIKTRISCIFLNLKGLKS